MVDKLIASMIALCVLVLAGLLVFLILAIFGVVHIEDNPCTRPVPIGKTVIIMDRNDGWYKHDGRQVYCRNGNITDIRSSLTKGDIP